MNSINGVNYEVILKKKTKILCHVRTDYESGLIKKNSKMTGGYWLG
jgi:hypothetical protein